MSIRPATASIFLKCDYWPMVDKMNREEDNGAHPWQNDFISIHKSSFSNDWTLCSSLDLVDPITGARPSFEEVRHETFQEALNAAVAVALEHSKHIVVCSDPETGYDLQPDRSRNNGIFVPS